MKLYSTKEAAEHLGLSLSAIKYHIHTAKNLKPLKVGNSLVFTQEMLDEFKANRRPRGRPRKPICPHCKGTDQKILSHTMMCACPYCDGSGKRKEKSA